MRRYGLIVEPRGAHPTALGDIQHHPIRATIFDFNIAMMRTARTDTERLVDIVTRLRTRCCQLLGNGLQAFNLETDMVNTTVVFAAFHTRNDVILEIEDGQVNVPVAEVVAFGPRAIDLGNFFHAKHVNIKLGRGVHILGREGNVLDFWHDTSPTLDGSCQVAWL